MESATKGLDGVLLPGMVGVECRGDLDVDLFPEEEAALGAAVPRRRREFVTVRACARQALAGLGLRVAPIVPGPGRAPIWPVGVLGSLTHCDGYRAAVVARAGDVGVLGFGVDAEPDAPLPPRVLERVASPGERAGLARCGDVDGATAWDRLLFCAKEAVFKAWWPLTGQWLDFTDVEVDLQVGLQVDVAGIDGIDGTFVGHRAGAHRARIAGPGEFDGRFAAVDGVLIALATVTHGRDRGREGTVCDAPRAP